MKIDRVVTLATAYIEDPNGNVLLLKRGTKSSLSGHWQFAEGKIETGEFPDDTLEREVSEELSVPIIKMVFKTVSHVFFETPGVVFFIQRVVYLTKLESKDIKLSDEHVDCGWFTKEELLRLQLVPGVREVIEAVG